MKIIKTTMNDLYITVKNYDRTKVDGEYYIIDGNYHLILQIRDNILFCNTLHI